MSDQLKRINQERASRGKPPLGNRKHAIHDGPANDSEAALIQSRPELPAKAPGVAQDAAKPRYIGGTAVPQAKPPRQDKPRLPHRSAFAATYDATKEEWSGTLAVHDSAGCGGVQTFQMNCRGVFGLLSKLDTLYRDWLKENPQ